MEGWRSDMTSDSVSTIGQCTSSGYRVKEFIACVEKLCKADAPDYDGVEPTLCHFTQ